MKKKLYFLAYCLVAGFLGFFARLVTSEFQILKQILFMGGSLLLILGIYIKMYDAFENKWNRHFRFKQKMLLGIGVSLLIGVFSAISSITTILVFGNEMQDNMILMIQSYPGISEVDKAEGIERAQMIYSWWAISGLQLAMTLILGIIYTAVVSLLFRMHPMRVKE